MGFHLHFAFSELELEHHWRRHGPVVHVSASSSRIPVLTKPPPLEEREKYLQWPSSFREWLCLPASRLLWNLQPSQKLRGNAAPPGWDNLRSRSDFRRGLVPLLQRSLAGRSPGTTLLAGNSNSQPNILCQGSTACVSHEWLTLVLKEWLRELVLAVGPAWRCQTCSCEGKLDLTIINSLEVMYKVTANRKRFTDPNTRLITFTINKFLYLSWECGQLYVFTLDFVALVNQWPEVLRWDPLYKCEVIEVWEWVMEIFWMIDTPAIIRSFPGLQQFINTLLLFVSPLEKRSAFIFLQGILRCQRTKEHTQTGWIHAPQHLLCQFLWGRAGWSGNLALGQGSLDASRWAIKMFLLCKAFFWGAKEERQICVKLCSDFLSFL